MSRRQSPNEAQPVVQRIRLRYGKSDRLRFASHRDFQRALERAVRRAGLPVAMSGGFNPHPRISYANAAPTGAASAAEYVEVGLAEAMPVAEFAASVSAGLPSGFTVTDAVESPGGALAELLEASRWRIEIPGHSEAEIDEAIHRLLSAPEPVTVTRVTKSGTREIAVGEHWVSGAAGPGHLTATVRTATPTVRPEDIVRALGLEPMGRCTREAQGPVVADGVGDPWGSPVPIDPQWCVPY
ncbi:MAG: TIGR03936 family radical SAM-associated protein [Candidatus Nanopelagicales bacterium]